MLQYRGLHSHQTFINTISLMKRESEADRQTMPTPQMMNFSFGKYFDERMMSVYHSAIQ